MDGGSALEMSRAGSGQGVSRAGLHIPQEQVFASDARRSVMVAMFALLRKRTYLPLALITGE